MVRGVSSGQRRRRRQGNGSTGSRHIFQHPCGPILGDRNLLSHTPTQPCGIGLAMSQFDKDDIDDVGFLKLDVLRVRMQSPLARAVRETPERRPPSRATPPGRVHPSRESRSE
jgi:error-prone DNA polymerase